MASNQTPKLRRVVILRPGRFIAAPAVVGVVPPTSAAAGAGFCAAAALAVPVASVAAAVTCRSTKVLPNFATAAACVVDVTACLP